MALTGIARSTWHYRKNPRPAVKDPVAQALRVQPQQHSRDEVKEMRRRISQCWGKGESVDQARVKAWDEGEVLGSRSSWYRIAAAMDQEARPARRPRSTPVATQTVMVRDVDDMWAWDITNLYAPMKGRTFKVYSVEDIASRTIIAFRVEDREDAALAVELFESAIAANGGVAPTYVHADSGAAMKNHAMSAMFADYGITETHSRPRVSNDNAFKESEFRTMKHRPGYPGIFTDLDHARDYVTAHVAWYNTKHHHSGIAYFTPAQVRDGSWRGIHAKRVDAMNAYYDKHPQRFRRRPVVETPIKTQKITCLK